MSPVYIHDIKSHLPPHRHEQDQIREQMERWTGDKRTARKIRLLHKRSGIQTRYSVLPDFEKEPLPGMFSVDQSGRVREPSTGMRNQFYAREADRLSVEAVGKLLADNDSFPPGEITHLITVSCTGFYNPGPDYRIIRELGLSPSTQRYNLGFMGCYAAFPALRMASQFCRADPQAVVLILCLEFCTLHLQFNGLSDSLLANTLFGDGLAAALISSRPGDTGRQKLRIDKFSTQLVPEGEKSMAWDIGDSGFNIVLSSYVPDVISLNIGMIIEALFKDAGLAIEEVDLWAVHPGGKAILDKVQASLGLAGEKIGDSRAVLRDYGNMSSATILFVLERILQRPATDKETICAMAFGPGLVVESALLEQQPGN